MITVTNPQKKQPQQIDGRGLSALAFAALLLAAFVVVAVCAVIGGWPGLAGIAVSAVLLAAFAAHRL